MHNPSDTSGSKALQKLRQAIRKYSSALVAFSGGVDSTLLLHVTNEVLGEQCHAMTAISETMAHREQKAAAAVAVELGMQSRHRLVRSQELSRGTFAQNDKTRCALCKTELLSLAHPMAKQLGLSVVFLGTNIDDLGDFRPGVQAAKDLGAVSPMVEAGLTKQDVRDVSKELGLSTWNKPQLACLSSRFPYGEQITKEKLRTVDAFEDALHALGFSQVRVRYHGSIARIEVPENEIAKAVLSRSHIVTTGKELGFLYVTIDLLGFRSGSLNEGLEQMAVVQPLVQLGRSS